MGYHVWESILGASTYGNYYVLLICAEFALLSPMSVNTAGGPAVSHGDKARFSVSKT